MTSSDSSEVGTVAKIDRKVEAGFAARIEAWLNRNVPRCRGMRITSLKTPSSGGLSGETYIVSLAEKRNTAPSEYKLVLKKDVVDRTTNPQSDFDNMITLQTALGVMARMPVPRVLGVERESDVLGARFVVMEYMDGDIAADVPPYTAEGWVKDATPDQRRRLWTSGIDFLVALHGLDWQPLELEPLRLKANGADDLERCLNRSIDLFRVESNGLNAPICEQAIDWLREHRPSSGPGCINWGDARIGNIIWRDFECAAVIDWEMCGLGCPGIDLGWWSFFHRWSTHGQGLPDLDGMCVGQQLADLYHARGGARIAQFRYFEILAAIRGLSIWLRTYEALRTQGAFVDLAPLGDSVHMVRVLHALMDDAG